jgi:hypothetical protein
MDEWTTKHSCEVLISLAALVAYARQIALTARDVWRLVGTVRERVQSRKTPAEP